MLVERIDGGSFFIVKIKYCLIVSYKPFTVVDDLLLLNVCIANADGTSKAFPMGQLWTCVGLRSWLHFGYLWK